MNAPSVAALAPHLRPRERLDQRGARALDDVELLALVLGGAHSLLRAHRLLAHFGGLSQLARTDPAELAHVEGMGSASAAALAAGFELGRRALATKREFPEPFTNPNTVAEHLRCELFGLEREHFIVLGLDARQRLRLERVVAIGSLAAVEVHPREVFRPLVHRGIHSAIVAHNHPSGSLEPSGADVDLTMRLAESGRILGIPLLDHIIVTAEGSASLATMGLM